MNCEVPGHSGKRAGHELLCTVGRHESHARLQPLVVVSQDRPVLDNHLLFSPRGFVDGVPALTGSRQSKKNDSLPSSAPVSDELLRKRPKSKRRTPGRVALPSSYAIASMHSRRQLQGRKPHIMFIARPARIPRSSQPQTRLLKQYFV